jgi:hypothetical protein
MLCCVIAGVVFAAITHQLARLPVVGGYFRRKHEKLARATEWRLFDD